MSEKLNVSSAFILRQFFRLFFIFPYLAVVYLAEFFVGFKKTEIYNEGVCFIVSSIIYPASRPLSYGVRSFFDAAQRMGQTKSTIESIRRYVPTAKIVLVEGGLNGDISNEIIALVDNYIYLGNEKIVRLASDSPLKSLGETVLLMKAFGKFPKVQTYFKMSGRYSLNEEFDLKSWQGAGFNFHYVRNDFVSTRLYSFNYEMRIRWYFALVKSLPYLIFDYPLEYLLQKFIPKRLVTSIERVGISGFDGVNGNVIRE